MHKNVCILLFHFFLCWHIKERCLLLWPVAWGLTCIPGYQYWLHGNEYNSTAECLRWIFCWGNNSFVFLFRWMLKQNGWANLRSLLLKTTPLRIWHSAAEGHLAWQYSIYMPNDELCAGHLIIVTYIFYISGSCKTFITSYKMLYVKHQKYKMITRIQKM